MFTLWILLYIIGFVVTTLVMKFFELGYDLGADWWMAVFMWPLFVPIALCVMFITKVGCATGSWWDKVSDEIVTKLKERSSRSPTE